MCENFTPVIKSYWVGIEDLDTGDLIDITVPRRDMEDDQAVRLFVEGFISVRHTVRMVVPIAANLTVVEG